MYQKRLDVTFYQLVSKYTAIFGGFGIGLKLKPT
jgi:hypothetical protein